MYAAMQKAAPRRTVHGCEVPTKQLQGALHAQSWPASSRMSSLVCSFCGHISLT